MNVEQLNVTELNAEELVAITGGRYTPSELYEIFKVTDEAYNELLRSVWESNGWNN